MSMFNDISWGSKDNMKECESNAQLVYLYAKRFGAGQWSFLGPGSEKKWYSISEDSPEGEWDKIAELMMLKFGESTHQSFDLRVHCPEECLREKVVENYQYTSAPTLKRLKLFFAQLFLLISFSLYGAVAEMCEEYESHHDRTGRPVVRGQSSPSFVPSVIKTNILLNDDPANEEYLLQRYRERIVKLSQQGRLSKFCIDAGFLTTVEVGQYFMTKDTEEFSQFTDSVACREYTLPRDEDSSEPKGWIRGNTKI